MKTHNHPLITTVFVMGIIIALFSYLFHPDVGVLTLMVNGQPMDNAFIRFAAIPGALVILLICGILVALLLFGVGVMMFLAALFIGLLGVFLIAPFFWPFLVVIFVLFALMSPHSHPKG